VWEKDIPTIARYDPFFSWTYTNGHAIIISELVASGSRRKRLVFSIKGLQGLLDSLFQKQGGTQKRNVNSLNEYLNPIVVNSEKGQAYRQKYYTPRDALKCIYLNYLLGNGESFDVIRTSFLDHRWIETRQQEINIALNLLMEPQGVSIES
jgi:hypothetical protein